MKVSGAMILRLVVFFSALSAGDTSTGQDTLAVVLLITLLLLLMGAR